MCIERCIAHHLIPKLVAAKRAVVDNIKQVCLRHVGVGGESAGYAGEVVVKCGVCGFTRAQPKGACYHSRQVVDHGCYSPGASGVFRKCAYVECVACVYL